MTDGGGIPRGPKGGGGVENCIICGNGVNVGGGRTGGATFMGIRGWGKEVEVEVGGRGRSPTFLFPVVNPNVADETETLAHCAKFDDRCKDCKSDNESFDNETGTVDPVGIGWFPESSGETLDWVFCAVEVFTCAAPVAAGVVVEPPVLPTR